MDLYAAILRNANVRQEEDNDSLKHHADNPAVLLPNGNWAVISDVQLYRELPNAIPGPVCFRVLHFLRTRNNLLLHPPGVDTDACKSPGDVYA